jgi:hypothetical protein
MIPRYGEWERRYRSRGLSVVGVHTPETDAEQDTARLARFVQSHGIDWPVVIDADEAVWQRYRVDAWPTIILIDRAGTIRATFVGDDQSAAIEKALGRLL